jgi:hypothetical protein
MQLRDMPIDELRRALAATERAAGQDSQSARVLRRELEQRERAQVTTPDPDRAEPRLPQEAPP